MSDSKHTPTPWEISEPGNRDAAEDIWILGAFEKPTEDDEPGYDGGQKVVAHVTTTPEQEANAALIIRAVNMHDELVNLLKRISKSVGVSGLGGSLPGEIRQAIAKAEVK